MNGLLLINLGTPDAPETGAVRTYLREFLSDPRVLDINALGRKALLEGVILRTRPAKSAAAYRLVWDAGRGSPLLFHSRDLTEGVRGRLGDDWRVELGMRYGNPSIKSAFRALIDAGVNHIVVFPLFPHYAASSTGSALEVVHKLAAEAWNVPSLSTVGAFYDDPGFIDAFSAVGREVIDDMSPDHVLFSYHGLPERHMRKSDYSGNHCLADNSCCDTIVTANRDCYRAQCYATTREIAAALELTDDGHSVSFQSRLGRDPWIKPYTDHVIPELAKSGVKKLAVFCPAFVADCLETLEEIGMRADEDFKAAGGEELRLIPSLNSTERWCDAVAELSRANAPGAAG